MGRNFEPTQVITLPTLSANEAHTLAQALVAAAQDEHGKPRKLSEPIRAALDDVDADRKALLDELGGGPPVEKVVQAADRREDRAVAALARVLDGFALLEGEIPLGELAARLRTRLFPDGTGFLKLKPREEWSEVEHRLQTIKDEHLAKDLDALGAAPLLAHLQKVHVEYGKATGATASVAAPESQKLREKRDVLIDSIRHYVAAVVGSIQRKKPETQQFANALLQPLIDWESKPRNHKSTPDAPNTPSTPTSATG